MLDLIINPFITILLFPNGVKLRWPKAWKRSTAGATAP